MGSIGQYETTTLQEEIVDSSTFQEWLSIALRWLHVIAGIYWIGQTHVFMRLERSLKQGQLWAVHGGGFWKMQKFETSEQPPDDFIWFKWASLMAWISGMLLLVVTYYLGGLMVFPDSPLTNNQAIIIGVVIIFLGTLIYRFVWDDDQPGPLPKIAGPIASYIAITALSWGLCSIMSGRAAYIHIGAIFGTIMVTNVWFTILPAQRQLIARKEGRAKADYGLAERAAQCSKHNTFLSIPLIFIMVSNHYPVATYGSDWNWLVLSGLVLAGWIAAIFVRKYF
ncbi:MAG: urate hydroxylase PuuD [bacterium]|nr:urate hydroxylase PuuD [bacterium]